MTINDLKKAFRTLTSNAEVFIYDVKKDTYRTVREVQTVLSLEDSEESVVIVLEE